MFNAIFIVFVFDARCQLFLKQQQSRPRSGM